MSWFWEKASKKSGPRYEARPILAPSKAKFFVRLCKALPTFYIFPQVALPTLLAPTAENHKAQKEDGEKIAGLWVDFVLYNADLTLVCVASLDDGSTDANTDAVIDHCLKNAGIKTIRWSAQTTPSVEQIRRTLMPSIDMAKANPDAANKAALESEVTIQGNTVMGDLRQDAPDTVLMMRQSDPVPSNIRGLSPAMLDQLTPKKVLQTKYPHIWQRINAFAIEPKHLKKYLLSLSMQDRTEKRAGFSLDALKEIADIQIQNDRFLMDAVRTWQPGIVNP